MKVGTDGVLLGAWAGLQNANTALDIGTGTGLIALMLAQRSQQVMVDAIDIDKDAYEQAKENASQCSWFDRIAVHHCSIQDFAATKPKLYDLVVSNPPFFSGGTLSHDQDMALVRHTVKLPHGDLLTAVRSVLSEKGKFCVVLPYIEGLRFMEIAKTYRFFCHRITEVKGKKEKPTERLLIELGFAELHCEKNQLTIQENEKDWTPQYVALTQAFYLNS